MFGKRYEKLLGMVTALSLQVMDLQNRMAKLEVEQEISAPEEVKPDPVQERINRKFTEGLDNLLSYDGTRQEESVHGDE